MSAFNDAIEAAGDGDDHLIGDVYYVSPTGAGPGTVDLSAEASGAVPGTATVEEGHAVTAYNDGLKGDADDDELIGDVYVVSDGTATVDLAARATGGVSSSAAGGHTVSAYNDDVAGGAGADTLVGDVYMEGGGTLNVTVEGDDAGHTIQAFQDTLTGGVGDDVLYGDFYDGTGALAVTLDLGTSADFVGRDLLFADDLDGGAGADFLAGGLGGDAMTGGTGVDTFAWFAGDLAVLDFGGAIPVDTIDDFSSDIDADGTQAEANVNDVLDLADLLADLGFDDNVDDIDDWLRLVQDGTSMNLEIDRDGTDAAEAFEVMLVLENTEFVGVGLDSAVDELFQNGQLIVD